MEVEMEGMLARMLMLVGVLLALPKPLQGREQILFDKGISGIRPCSN